MKHLAALIALAALPFSAQAQWPTDPSAPLVVCDAAFVQSAVRAMPDGSGGWYCFWMDKRVDGTTAALYGQRYDAEGNAQWTANGKAILAPVGETVLEFAVTRMDNGALLIAYLHHPTVYADTLSALALDADGDPAWAEPTNITYSGTPILGLGEVRTIPSPGGAVIAWYDTYFGGSNGVNITRITYDGSLPWGTDGYAIPNAQSGPFHLFDDGQKGAIVQWRTSNGSGAHLYAMRVDSTGANNWPANVNTSMGGAGLSYVFQSVTTDQNSLITAWRNTAGHLDMARLDTNSTLAWGNLPTVLCGFASSQDSPVLCKVGNEYVAAWVDNRPPASNADLYVQRFDGNGQLQWAADGLLGIQTNTYIPTPGIVPSTSGAVIVTMDGNVAGFGAQRILDDGSQDWPAYVPFCLPSFNPFYADQVKLSDGAGGVVAFWSNNDQVYAAHIDVNGQLGDHTGVNDQAGNSASLRVFPSITDGPMSVLLPEGLRPQAIRALDAQGRATELPITASSGDRVQLDASALTTGLYLLEVSTDAGLRMGRFVVAR